MEVDATNDNAQPLNKNAHNYRNELQPFVKDESDDNGDLFDDADDHDEEVYKPRPQLPQPNVYMRSLAGIIGE
jgi:hypothetical protein